VRAALVEAAWAASHPQETSVAAQSKRWVKHMGKKKALVAVGQSSLVIASHVLQTRTPYQELGSDYFEQRNVDKQRNRLMRQVESLGGGR